MLPTVQDLIFSQSLWCRIVPVMTNTQLARGALVALGVLGGHLLGSYAASGGLFGDHSYLGWATILAAPLAIAAIGYLAVRRVAQLGTGDVRWRWLAQWQVVAFVVLEAVEHVASGEAAWGVAEHPSFWLGLVAQPAVAWLIGKILDLGEVVARTLVATGRRTAEPFRLAGQTPPAVAFRRTPVLTANRRRGPPLSVC